MYEDSFYTVHTELNSDEHIKPDLVFAMGLGNKSVEEYGRFVVKQVYQQRSNNDASKYKELKVVLCNDTKYASNFVNVENNEALYCLEDYGNYIVKGDKSDDAMFVV